MKVEINEPTIKSIYNDIEENEIFIIPRYEGKVFIKLKGFTACTKDTAKECNAICLNDGSFIHLDYDEFVIPCKSKLSVWKTYKEE